MILYKYLLHRYFFLILVILIIDDISKTWQKKIFSFSKVTDTVLLGWISGKEAEYAETLTQDTIADTCTDILRKFLNDPYVPKPKVCVW